MSDLNKIERLGSPRDIKAIDASVDSRLEALTKIAKSYFDVPNASISLVGKVYQEFAARLGLDATGADRDLTFCHRTIQNAAPLLVPDASVDDRFGDTQSEATAPHIRFYAGAPLVVEGVVWGTLCIFDHEPRELDASGLEKLTSLADMASTFVSTPVSGDDVKAGDRALASAHAIDRGGDRVGPKSRDFLELILMAIPDVVFVKDAAFRHIQGNPAFFDLFPEEIHDTLIGMTGTEEFEPEQVDAYQAKDREAFANGYSIATEKITVKGGEPQSFETKKTRFEDEAGNPFLLGVARNITELLQAKQDLAEAKSFQELILDNIPDPVYVKDADGIVILANNAFFKLFPTEYADQIIGSDAWSFLADGASKKAKLSIYQQALTTGYAEAIDKHRNPDGSELDLIWRKHRFENRQGEVFILAIARDVTMERQAERRLETASEFQSLMLHHMPDLIFVKDEEFRIVEANENFLNVYPEEMRDGVVGSTTVEEYSEEEREAFLAQDRLAFENGFSEVEESIEFPDGARRVLLTKKVRFNDPEGKQFVLGMARDITELVHVRKENEDTRELLQNVFDTVTGAVIGLDNDRQILMINDAGREMLAGDFDTVPFTWPENITFLQPEDMRPLETSHDPISRALIGQRIGGEVHMMTSLDASQTRYVRVTSALVENQASPLRCVIVLDDVSEAERNRQQIERRSRLDALGQLTGGIAHDFNNLLNTMQYALALIGREQLSERGERSMSAALKSIGRGAELTNRLLAFAKKQPARSIALPVVDVFAELEGLVRPALEASISVEFEEVSESLMVFCDQGQLQNAVLNLILNSRDAILQAGVGQVIRVNAREIDALPSHPKDITSEEAVFSSEGRAGAEQTESARGASQSQRYVEISVSDNGPGMTKAVVSRAIDPFFTTKSTNSGTGLGLSMVYGFVQQSDGEVRIYTEEGQGTTVKLYLPFGNELTGREAPVAVDPTVEGKGETILVVEDEPYLLGQLAELLEELNYKPLKVSSGRAALALIKAGTKFDLLLTDVVMPGGLGGFELARLARAIVPDVPIIYMSGYTGFTDEEMGAAKAPLLPKPSSPAITSAKIRSVLDQANSA